MSSIYKAPPPNDLSSKAVDMIRSQQLILSRLPAVNIEAGLILIQIQKHPKLAGMINMDSKQLEFAYSQPNKFCHSFQSNLENEEEFTRVKELCEQIVNSVREIDSIINKKQSYDGIKGV